LLCGTRAFGLPKADELRKSMYVASDSTKAAILVNIAKLYQYENVDSCIYYAQIATDRAYSTRQYLALIDAQTLLSQIAIDRKNYERATTHQKTILEMATRLRLWDRVMDSYNDLAQAWLFRNNYAEAVEFLKEGLKIAVDRNNLEKSIYFYQALIESYRKLRNMDAVCNYYNQLMETNRSMDAQAYDNRINAMQAERETLVVAAEDARNWRQQQMTVTRVLSTVVLIWAILISAALVAAYIWFQYKFKPDMVKSQKEMSDKANQLDLLMKEQEKSFRFLTNHVYTNINALSESISLLEAKHDKKPVAADSVLNRINKDIFALYGFFQNFMLLLQIQSGQLKIEPTTVNIPHLATDLLDDYQEFAFAKDILLVNEVQNNTFAIGDQRLVDIVLRNIMSNAFKYAPGGTGRITLGTKIGTKVTMADGIAEDAGFIEVWVTDDGIGLTPEQVGMLFDLNDNLTLPGEFESKGYGVGLAVCRAVIEKMQGRIWAETKPGEGFCMRFNLPRAMETEVKTLTENTQEIVSTEITSENPLLLLE